jgi:hypothetical protein
MVDGVQIEGVATEEVTFNLKIANKNAPLPAHHNNLLGPLPVTKWHALDFVNPPGPSLKTSGGIDADTAETIFTSVLLGDADAVVQALSAVAAGDEEEAPAWSVTDVYGLEPLAHAASAGHTEVVTALVDARASVDARSPDERTALHRASRAGHEEVVKLLIKHGAFVDAEASDGATALQTAALAGKLEVVQELLIGGASLAHRDAFGATPLMAAAQGGHVDVVSQLMQPDSGATVNFTDENGWEAVHHACAGGHGEAAKLLAERGATIDGTTRGGRTIADFDVQIDASLEEVRSARKAAAAAGGEEAEDD